MSVGKRLRFEILKRDGFRCRYCGATPLVAGLRVDHVHPRAQGGTDDPANLISSCHDCNAGKSDVRLDESRLPETPAADDLREQAEQIREYLAAAQELADARASVSATLADWWMECTGRGPDPVFARQLDALAVSHPLDRIREAMVAAGGARSTSNRVAYFYGVLKRRASGVGSPNEEATRR